MGLYDRDYYRDDQKYRKTGSGHSAVTILILLNVGLYIADHISGGSIFEEMMLAGITAPNPLQWYRCLTYAFAHDPNGLLHILCNMLVIFFFGPPLERRYGKAEFSLFYLGSAVFAGVIWNVLNFGANTAALGASGAATALVILFALNYPKVQLLLWGIIPLPAWLAGVLYVVYDMYGSIHSVDNIAHDIHISGAVFAALYFISKIRFTSLMKGVNSTGRRSGSISDASTKRATFSFNAKKDRDFEELEKEVDEILRKISRSGEESLTEKERETLRYASQEYQKRKNRQ